MGRCVVRVQGNDIGDEGVASLAPSLRDLAGLTQLNLWGEWLVSLQRSVAGMCLHGVVRVGVLWLRT